MNRKNKIVVSIVGITIVLLALLGLTYGYYLTRIQGNTNTTSISISTADLKLEYSEEEDSNIGLTGLMPGQDIPAKTFTVTNSGNSKVDDYVVAIIDVINTLSRTGDLTYTLTCTEFNAENEKVRDCNGVEKIEGTEYGPSYPKQPQGIVLNSIESGYRHEYSLKLNYRNFEDEDQSIDMGSTIKGKIQIYGNSDTIDLTGTVTGASEGDYVQINSTPMTSDIIEGKYILVGIEPGVHSLKIMDKDGTLKTEQRISIESGSIESIGETEITLEDQTKETVPLITMTSDSTRVTVDINKTTTEYDINIIEKENPFEEGTLAYEIVNNSYSVSELEERVKGYAIYRPNPTTIPAERVNNSNEASLSQTEDDNTTTTNINSYYFRGNVKNNYVNFAGMCWRVVRIEGDGSVKLILEDRNEQCNDKEGRDLNNNGTYFTGNWSDGNKYEFGHNKSVFQSNEDYVADFINYEDEDGLQYSFKSFQSILTTKISEEYDGEEIYDKLKIDEWCYDYEVKMIDDIENHYYGANKRIQFDKNPSLKCSGTKLTKFKDETNMYVSTLTADEVVFAGTTYENNFNYYLINDYAKNKLAWWTLSPSYMFGGASWDYIYYLNVNGEFNIGWAYEKSNSSRPAVTLKSTTEISSGFGTQDSPYIIK